MSDSPSNQVTLSKDVFYGIVIMGLAVLLVISALTQGFGIVKSPPLTCPPCNESTVQPAANQSGNGTAEAAEAPVMRVPSLLSDSPLKGSESNGLTLIEFSDFQCPFCGMTYGSAWADAYASRYGPIIGTIKSYEADYVDTGKAALRHYPVAFLGQESVDASNAAMCANAQGKYWEMHDAIYDAQTPEENDGKYSKDNLKLLAQNISGLDQAAFAACLDADTYATEVEDFTSDWQAVSGYNTGSAGTPTFYILADASKFSEAEVKAAAAGAGFEYGVTDDGNTYVLIASPEYAKLKLAIDALLG